MSFTNTEALVVYATIKELEATGVNVDYIRRIGGEILASFNVTEEQLDMQLNAIKAGAPYPLPTPEEPAPEPEEVVVTE